MYNSFDVPIEYSEADQYIRKMFSKSGTQSTPLGIVWK